MAYFEEKPSKALKHFKEALLFRPNSPYLYKRIADIYEKEGLLAEALHYYQKMKRIRNQDLEAQQKLTELYRLRNLYKKAFDHQKELLQEYPEHFSVWFEQSLLLSYQGQWKEALKALETAGQLALNPAEKAQTLLPKAYILAKMKKADKVLHTIQELEKRPYPTEEFALKIADFYKSLGLPLLGIQYLEKVQKTKGETVLISKALLKYYLSKSKWKQARQQIWNIQTLGQLEEPHYFYMALLYFRGKKL